MKTETGGISAARKAVLSRRRSIEHLERIRDDPHASESMRMNAINALTRIQAKGKHKPKKLPGTVRAEVTREMCVDLRRRIKKEPGYSLTAGLLNDKEFMKDVKRVAEVDLYFFNKFILGMGDLVAHLHKDLCKKIQNPGLRRKLILMPVGHLKTSCGTHGFTLFLLIQPKRNPYFDGLLGRDFRILVTGENKDKAVENLSFIKAHAERNVWLRALWPEAFWEDPAKESPRWSEDEIELPRTRIKPEPTVQALGAESGIFQRHYEVIIIDDLISLKTAQSPVRLMVRADNFRKGLRSRYHDPVQTLELGIGTRWAPGDIYVDWLKELPDGAKEVRSALEDGEPIWPERFTAEALDALRADVGDYLFSLMYMNNPLSKSFTALDWSEVRQCEVEDGLIWFNEDERDTTLKRVFGLDGMPTIQGKVVRRGMLLSDLYPKVPRAPQFNFQEGERDWVRLDYLKRKYPERSGYRKGDDAVEAGPGRLVPRRVG